MQDDYCGEESLRPKTLDMYGLNITSLQFYSQKQSYYKDNKKCFTRILPHPGKGLILTIRRLRTRAGFWFDISRCSNNDYVIIGGRNRCKY